MTSSRPARRYAIPSWLLAAIALAAFITLVLTPGPAIGAPAETYPPALPLDPLPSTALVDAGVYTTLIVVSLVIGAAVFLYGHLSLNTSVLERLRTRLRRRV